MSQGGLFIQTLTCKYPMQILPRSELCSPVNTEYVSLLQKLSKTSTLGIVRWVECDINTECRRLSIRICFFQVIRMCVTQWTYAFITKTVIAKTRHCLFTRENIYGYMGPSSGGRIAVHAHCSCTPHNRVMFLPPPS